MSALMLQGSLLVLPEGDVFRSVDQRMPLARPAEARSFTLSTDAPFVVSLAEMPAVHLLQIEADFALTIAVTSAAGTSQSIPVEFLFLVSRKVPITGISLLRVAGQATAVRMILGQGA
jgi:hypothetical protein